MLEQKVKKKKKQVYSFSLKSQLACASHKPHLTVSVCLLTCCIFLYETTMT